MGTTFASELLRELSNSQIDQIFVQTNQLFGQSAGDSLDLSQYDTLVAFADEDTETICHIDEAELVTYSDITS